MGSTGSDLLWNSILHSKQTELFNCAENRGSDQLFRLFLRFYAASGVRLYERYDISGLLFDSAYDHLGGGILGGSVVKILGMGFGQIGAWVIIVIAIVISVIVMTQKPILAPIHEKTNDHRRMAEERRQERLARQAAMEEEEGKELILEPVEEPKKAGKKKKSRLLSHVESKADLNENDDTHQMEMPELSIHRGSVPAEEPEKTGPEMTRQAAEEAKKRKRLRIIREIRGLPVKRSRRI